MPKTHRKKDNTNLWIVGGLALGGLYLLSQSRGESPAETIQNIIPSGETGSSLTENLFGGTSPVLDFGGMFEGLNLGGGGGTLGGGGMLDLSGLLGGLGGGGDGNINFPDLPDFDFTGKDSITDILGAVGDLAWDLGKAGAVGAGTYLGFKALSPVAPQIGKSLAAGIRSFTPVLQNTGRIASNVTGGISRGVTSAIPSIGTWLTTPVTELGVTGTLGAIPLVAASGYGGYKLGEFLVEKTPVKAVPEIAGDIGAWASRNVQNVPVVGGTLQNWLGWEHADVVQNTTVDWARKAASKGLTGIAASNWIREQRGQEGRTRIHA